MSRKRVPPCLPLGRVLRLHRERCKLALRDVEERTQGEPGSISSGYLCKVELDGCVPSLDTLLSLSRLYGVRWQSLVELLELGRMDESVSAEARPEALLASGRRSVRDGHMLQAVRPLTVGLRRWLAERPDAIASREYWRRYVELAIALKDIGRIPRAEEILRDTLDSRHVEPEVLLIAHHNLANLLTIEGRTGRARRQARSLQKAAENASNTRALAGFHSIVSQIELQEGNYAEATGAAEESLVVFERLRSMDEAEVARSNLARCLVKEGKPQQAYPLHRKALDRLDRIRHPRGRHSVLYLHGETLLDAGHFPAARQRFRRANRMADEHGYRARLFSGHFQLLKLAEEEGDAHEQKRQQSALWTLRPNCEAMTDEVREFDNRTEREMWQWH